MKKIVVPAVAIALACSLLSFKSKSSSSDEMVDLTNYTINYELVDDFVAYDNGQQAALESKIWGVVAKVWQGSCKDVVVAVLSRRLGQKEVSDTDFEEMQQIGIVEEL